MHTMKSIVLMISFCSTLLFTCSFSNVDISTTQFFKDIKERPVLLYQCYHSGNTIDPPTSTNFTILFDGTNPSTTRAVCTTWSATKETPNSYVTGSLEAYYDPTIDLAVLTTSSIEEFFTVQEPFVGKTLYVRIEDVAKNETVVYKIYDTDFECTNAKKLLKKVCPDPCDMELTREISNI
ncbi:uncharacterized protein LOC121837108 [Ixodes scapularis]|uniref:uncharacterized protein LOC121837108 n=1 Tax=Ixodes scapularis TaxID=6945 RepID=UPI001C3839E9|nr:uncharacterized protein LOC121837108 [Ixodes scapularis]